MFGLGGDSDPFEESVGPGEPFLEIEELQTYYDEGGFRGEPVRAVDGVDLTVAAGETVGVVGESGCGKTTLGRTIVGLESPSGGQILSRGVDVTSLSGSALRRWQRDVTMVFQDPGGSLDDRLTVGEIIREPLDTHDIGTPDERRRRVFQMLERVGLSDEHFYRYPHQFSGGQRQRIGIARALVVDPEFVILDEPVSALDVSVQARIINLLERLQDELGLAYLFIAHDLSVVRHISDRVAVMYLGGVVEQGATEAVFNSPSHPYTTALLSAVPGTHARGIEADGARITLPGTPPNPRDPPSGCPFTTRCPAKIRPSDTEVALPDDVWTGIDELRALLRERARRDGSVVGTVATRLGLSSDDAVAAAAEELFGGHDLPPSVDDVIDSVVDRAAAGRNAEAAEQLRDQFGSVCDEIHPDPASPATESRASVSDDSHTAACLRVQDNYDDTSTVIDRRYRTSRRATQSTPDGTRED